MPEPSESLWAAAAPRADPTGIGSPIAHQTFPAHPRASPPRGPASAVQRLPEQTTPTPMARRQPAHRRRKTPDPPVPLEVGEHVGSRAPVHPLAEAPISEAPVSGATRRSHLQDQQDCPEPAAQAAVPEAAPQEGLSDARQPPPHPGAGTLRAAARAHFPSPSPEPPPARQPPPASAAQRRARNTSPTHRPRA